MSRNRPAGANPVAVSGICAIYLVTDEAGRVRWLGQVNRSDDLAGRMREHESDRERRQVFAWLRFLHLHDDTPAAAGDSTAPPSQPLPGALFTPGSTRHAR